MGMPIETTLLAWPPRHHHQSSPTELLTMGLESIVRVMPANSLVSLEV